MEPIKVPKEPEPESFHHSPGQQMVDVMTGMRSDIRQPDERTDAFYEAIQKLYDGKNIHFITDLSENDINNIIRIREIWEWCDQKVDILKDIIDWKMKLRVSKKRKGRFEFFDTFKSRSMMEDMGEASWMRRMGGMGRMNRPM